MRYAFIRDHRREFPVRLMCKVLEVSHSGYYDWLSRPESPREIREQKILQDIVKIHKGSRDTYGSPRIHPVIQGLGHTCSVNTVARIMRKNGIRAKTKRKFKATTDSSHGRPVVPNLLKERVAPTASNEVYVGDITYIPTREGYLYLATVMDLFSRKIVGWRLSDRMKADLVTGALDMAFKSRNPGRGLIFHSDQGSQYASRKFRDRIDFYGMHQSMSRRGCCWDNASMESFFGSLKRELVYHEQFMTRKQAERAIFEWIEVFYNRQRLHSSLGYVSPEKFEVDRMAKCA